MNFVFESIKPDLKPENEDFFFEIETPRGHFFAVFDFDQHDFANLNTTLEAKLETIVGSFVTLSRFSADLFLGFLAKEINNFLNKLGQQSDGPELLCSAALCLVSGNRLFYLTSGNVHVALINQGEILPLASTDTLDSESRQKETSARRLGEYEQNGALTARIQPFLLKDDDVVLIMTGGVADELEDQTLTHEVSGLDSQDTNVICETLMEASEASQDDRTLVVIGGPYEPYEEPVTENADVSLAEGNALAFGTDSPNVLPREEGIGYSRQDESLRDALNLKADKDRLLELDQKLEHLSVVMSNKADTSDLLGLQSEVLKLGVLSNANSAVAEDDDTRDRFDIVSAEELSEYEDRTTEYQTPRGQVRSLLLAALILAVGVGGGFIGGWLQSLRVKQAAETWSVKTSGSQILISRLNGNSAPSIVTLNTAQPLKITGEQTFSSFGEVKQYIETITPAEIPVEIQNSKEEPETASQAQPMPSPATVLKEAKPPEVVTTIAFKQGDSLKKLAQQYNVAPAKLIALNPSITRWSLVKNGQRVVVPAGSLNDRPVRLTAEQSTVRRANGAATRKVTVAPGDTLDKLAGRHNLTPTRLKELNPQITNWSRIQAGQKVLVPTPVRG